MNDAAFEIATPILTQSELSACNPGQGRYIFTSLSYSTTFSSTTILEMPPRITLTTEKKKRRPHVKSKSGCSTCKRRQVRCDEHKPRCLNCNRLHLSCSYADEAHLSVIHQPIHPQMNDRVGWLDRDSYIFNHLSCLIVDLQQSKRQQLVFGGLVLHEYVALECLVFWV